MRYIGLDLGNRTCGLAISDPLGMIATSLYTIRFFEKDLNCALNEVVKVINEKKVEKIVIITKNKQLKPLDFRTLAA